MKKNSSLTFGQKAADIVANTVGSWRFIIIQSSLILVWIGYNALSGKPFDVYPFILLNLMLSFQAAYTGPLVMMSQNRQSEIDRRKAEADYIINRIAKREIENVQQEINLIKKEIVGENPHRERLQKMVDKLEEVQAGLVTTEGKTDNSK